MKKNTDLRDAFFDQVYLLGKNDPNFVFITDDMDAFGLRKFRSDFPKQFINIGVAEQNMIDVAAGMAAAGNKVFTFGICSYVTMRCFEQIKFSVCSMNLPVTIVGVGAGFSFGFDGPTHHGTQDIGIMRMLPEMTIYNPSDDQSTKQSAILAYKRNKPAYIRLDKGIFPTLYKTLDCPSGFKVIRSLTKVNIISTGIITHQAINAVDSLKKAGIDIGVVDILQIKPIPNKILQILKKSDYIISYEENSIIGGLGSILSDLISDNQLSTKLIKIAIPDKQYLKYGSREWFHKLVGIDESKLVSTIKKLV